MRGRYVFNLESLCPCELVHTAVAQLRVSLIMGNEHNRWGYHAAQLQAGDPKRRAIAAASSSAVARPLAPAGHEMEERHAGKAACQHRRDKRIVVVLHDAERHMHHDE